MLSVHSDRLILIVCTALAAVLGAAFGSFLNCAAWRIAHKESFLKGRSRCPKCGHALGALDLIPVFSWLFLRGKCRYCGEKVSIRYLVAELFFALVTVLCLLRFDLTFEALRNWIFLCCLMCLSLVDLEIFEIPDGCLIIATAAWFAFLPLVVSDWGTEWKDVVIHLASGIVLGGLMLGISLLMDRILKRDSLGGGDIKLLAVCGLYLGPWCSILMLIIACVLGLVFSLVMKRLGKRGENGEVPFGPSIALASAFVLLYGTGIINAYISLF